MEPVNRQEAADAESVVGDQLEVLAREGARLMAMDALNAAVNGYLQCARYRRREDPAGFRGYRNGTSPRRPTLGSGTIDLREHS